MLRWALVGVAVWCAHSLPLVDQLSMHEADADVVGRHTFDWEGVGGGEWPEELLALRVEAAWQVEDPPAELPSTVIPTGSVQVTAQVKLPRRVRSKSVARSAVLDDPRVASTLREAEALLQHALPWLSSVRLSRGSLFLDSVVDSHGVPRAGASEGAGSATVQVHFTAGVPVTDTLLCGAARQLSAVSVLRMSPCAVASSEHQSLREGLPQEHMPSATTIQLRQDAPARVDEFFALTFEDAAGLPYRVGRPPYPLGVSGVVSRQQDPLEGFFRSSAVSLTRETALPGLHRIQTVSVNSLRPLLTFESEKELSDFLRVGSCEVALVLRIPELAYLDVDEVHALGREHPSSSDRGPQLITPEQFIDVERPTTESTQHIVILTRELRFVGVETSHTSLVSQADAAALDQSIPRPGAEAGVAASLDPQRAHLLVYGAGDRWMALLDVRFRFPVHFRYQSPMSNCSSGACYAPVALAVPAVFERCSRRDKWTALGVSHETAASFAQAARRAFSQMGRAGEVSEGVGAVTGGHTHITTRPEGRSGADVLRPMPVGNEGDLPSVQLATAAMTMLTAGIVVLLILAYGS
jgi:hypothetical protein